MNTMFRTVFGKAAIAAALLGGFLLLSGAPGAKANDWDDCNRRPVYAYGRYAASERREAYERAEHYRQEWREHHRDRDDRYRGGWDRR